jgi:hypothetical protein
MTYSKERRPERNGTAFKSEATTDQSDNFNSEFTRSAASKQESEFDDLTARAAREWRAERRNIQWPPRVSPEDSATYAAIAEFAQAASECADALVWSAQQHDDRRRCAMYARQLAAATRTILVTVAELGKGAKP